MATLELLGVNDAADEAGVTRRTIRAWIDRGLGGRFLAAAVLGGDLYIDPRELDHFLDYRDRQNSDEGPPDDEDDYYEEN